MRCAPLLSPRTIQAQPNPLTMASVRSGSRACGPGQRGVDVGALGASEGQMLRLAIAAHALRGRSGRGGEPRGVRVERAIGQPCVRHRLERKGADAVEQPVPRDGAIAVVDEDERAAREAPDHVDRGRRGHVERLEDGLDRRRGAPPVNVGQRPQAPLVVGEQQLVAPPDRRPECSASLRLAARRVAQHAEAIVEATARSPRRTASWCAPRQARSRAAGRRATGTGRAPRSWRRAGRRDG